MSSRIWKRQAGIGGEAPIRPLRHAFRALAYRNYRLFFVGQGVSLVGTWMQTVAMSWLVYRMTSSPFILGLVGFTSQIPALLVAPFAGVLVDRWNKLRIVIGTQFLSMVQAGVLTALVLTGRIEVWHILVLSSFLGLVTGFDIPARQALFIDLVDAPEDLPNAIALNSSLFNAARLVGPAIAGFMIGWLGEGPVFLINTVSFFAVLASLFAMRIARRAIPAGEPEIFNRLREGFGYALGSPPIRTILALLSINSLLAMPYIVLLPVFATQVLKGGAQTLGFLMSAAGLGALGGALYLAGRRSVRGLSGVIVMSNTIFGVALVAVAFSRTVWLSIAILLFAGAGMMISTASINTILQTIVDPDKRGRIMSLYTMSFMGMAPIGSLAAGAAASRIGAPMTVLFGGASALLAGLWFNARRPMLRKHIRPIYERLGIGAEVAGGLMEATDARTPN